MACRQNQAVLAEHRLPMRNFRSMRLCHYKRLLRHLLMRCQRAIAIVKIQNSAYFLKKTAIHITRFPSTHPLPFYQLRSCHHRPRHRRSATHNGHPPQRMPACDP